MVIAGPGTGKTQILTLRIANIIKETDTDPSSILALTFTESGAYAMRKRLASMIGSPAYRVNIYTFHGFANDVIRLYPEEFPRIIGATSITDVEQIKILEDIIAKEPLKLLKPYGDPTYYVRPALSVITNLKRENISPSDFDVLVQTQATDFEQIPDKYHEKGAHKGKIKGVYADLLKQIEKNKEFSHIYRLYEDELRTWKFYDFDDMIMETVRVLESNSDLLLRLQENYQYILADEHQDANASQNRLLELLSSFHSDPNLFVVGDEKQAIFRFQGASLDNFLYFKKIYPNAKVISLESNYRSEQQILDAAGSVISNNKITDESLRVKLSAAQGDGKAEINVAELQNPDEESVYVASSILSLIERGVSPSEIAIFYRNNKDAFPIAKTLEKTHIPFVVASDQNVLADSDISKLLLLFRTIDSVGNERYLSELLYVDFFGFSPLDVFKVTRAASKERMSLFDAISSDILLQGLGLNNPDRFIEFSRKIGSWSVISKNDPLIDAFETIVHESGYMSHILSHAGSADKLEKLNALFDEARKSMESNRNAKLSDLLRHIDLLEEYGVTMKTGPVASRTDRVKLMTAHKSKGLEFEHVFIMGAYDGHWGNKREIHHFHVPLKGFEKGIDPIEDERRLFYVALTRAKKSITITYSQVGIRGEELVPSQFIAEIDPAHITFLGQKKIRKAVARTGSLSFVPKVQIGVPIQDREYIQSLFLEQGLSVTALNSYLKCPWSYFFNNLIRIPKVMERHQVYGTAVHNSLKEFFDWFNKGEEKDTNWLLSVFERHLRASPLSEADFNDSKEKGNKALIAYYTNRKQDWKRPLLTEFSVAGIPIMVSGISSMQNTVIHLRGIIDKIELLDDGSVNVVDYKTGKSKSRNDILGMTKSSDGGIFRQLVFYKLLLDSYEDGKYKMRSGQIDFIEPDEKGNSKSELFEVSPEDVNTLVTTIEGVAREILTLEFWNKECGEKDCEYCALRRMIQETSMEQL